MDNGEHHRKILRSHYALHNAGCLANNLMRTSLVKRQNPELRLRQWRLSRYRFEERQRRSSIGYVPQREKYVKPGSKILAPAFFDLGGSGGRDLIRFLRAISDSVLVHQKPMRLDFKLTERFHVPATILLFAELNRIIGLSEITKPISIIDPIRRRPREVLKQIGIHNLTSDCCDIVPEREDVVYWKATKGNTQTGDTYADLVEAVAERANRDHIKQLDVSGLWRSVSEAVANSVEHAYKRPRGDGFGGLDDTKWWMFSHIKDGKLSLAVCDLGCGYRRTINETLPETVIAFMTSRFGSMNRDALAIDTAMEYGRSGTHQSHRGKGSRDALSLLKRHGTGGLVVISNTGWIRYEFKDGKEISREDGSVGADIGGTVVWWSLPLNEGANADH